MKFLIVIVSLFLVQAEESRLTSYTCVTDYPTTSYLLESVGEIITLDVVHHNGVKNAPLFKGVVTADFEKKFKESVIYTALMGERFQVQFQAENCTRLNAHEISCFNSQPALIGQLNVDNYYFSAHVETNSSIYGEFKAVHINFQYRVNGWSHSIPMEFEVRQCVSK